MNDDMYPIDLTVMVEESEPAVYIRLSKFESLEDASAYAEFLTDYLPLMLFESKVMH
jgi:hypothetical protein